MKLRVSVLLSVFLLVLCGADSHGQQGKVYENRKFSPLVGTVQLYPNLSRGDQEMSEPIISIDQSTELLLQFDMLTEEYDNLQARIIHCNADWTKSAFNDIEFLYDYNSFNILDFDYSENTLQLYVNYWMRMPKVKRSGNYVVEVYYDRKPDQVLLSRRFVVFEQMVGINTSMRVASNVQYRQSNQQIDFSLNYSAMNVTNPLREIKVVLRQNQRWDNAIFNLQPTRVDQVSSQLEYRHFNSENNFRGGNEFRFFDLRVYNFRGVNVARIDKGDQGIDAFLVPTKSRGTEVYAQTRDQNGTFFIMTNETGASYLEADYIRAHFELKATALSEKVYVLGAFNDWRIDESSCMTYNAQTESYQGSAYLKQGFYDYIYWVDGDNPYRLEGSFYQTENDYDILVYYRGFTDLADRVVGYSSFNSAP